MLVTAQIVLNSCKPNNHNRNCAKVAHTHQIEVQQGLTGGVDIFNATLIGQ